LTPWLLPRPQRFMDDVWAPVLASNRWWLGDIRQESWPTRPSARSSSEDACAGIKELYTGHPCHGAPRGGGPNLVVARGPTRVPLTRVLGVGLMKAGSTAVWQALGAAVQLPMGFDCSAVSADILWMIAKNKEPLLQLLESCSEELFKWELAKDPMLTHLAGRLAAIWPAISAPARPLRLYFLVRSPFEWARSFLKHLGLAMQPPDVVSQQFTPENLPRPHVFTRSKQLFLDVQRSGLRYTGYVDAVVQGWALTVDEYLRCPQGFVLVRYEDFVIDPVSTTERLVRGLALDGLWSEASVQHVIDAAGFQYQIRSDKHGAANNIRILFGDYLYARIYAAVEARAVLLGYGELLGPPPGTVPSGPPIDMPPLTEPDCKP